MRGGSRCQSSNSEAEQFVKHVHHGCDDDDGDGDEGRLHDDVVVLLSVVYFAFWGEKSCRESPP